VDWVKRDGRRILRGQTQANDQAKKALPEPIQIETLEIDLKVSRAAKMFFPNGCIG
jgi:hypothetical protein